MIYLRLVLGLTKIDPKTILNLGCIGCIYHYLVACLCFVGSVGLGIVLVLDLNVGLGLNLLLCFIHVSCSNNVVILGLSVETIIDFDLGFCVSLGLSHTNLAGE